ncbi:hypothetical protein ACFL3Y_01545 [Pseudomonadota bacterium]
MRSIHFRPGLLGLFLLIPLAVLAQEDNQPLQSDWIDLVKGYRDQDTGVEMREVEYGSEAGARTITLAIPKSSRINPDEIEEVIVVGRRPPKPEPLDITYEWLDDYEDDNYGLVIRLGKNSNWPIRLYLDSSPGFVQ